MASIYEDEITLWRNNFYCEKCTTYNMPTKYVVEVDLLSYHCKVCGFGCTKKPFREEAKSNVFSLVTDCDGNR